MRMTRNTAAFSPDSRNAPDDEVMVRATGSRVAPSSMTTAPLTGPDVAASRTVPPMLCPRSALVSPVDMSSAIRAIRSETRWIISVSGGLAGRSGTMLCWRGSGSRRTFVDMRVTVAFRGSVILAATIPLPIGAQEARLIASGPPTAELPYEFTQVSEIYELRDGRVVV